MKLVKNLVQTFKYDFKRKVVIHLSNKEVNSANVEDNILSKPKRIPHVHIGYVDGEVASFQRYRFNSIVPKACGISRLESCDRHAINITICLPYEISEDGNFVANCSVDYFEKVKTELVELLCMILKNYNLRPSYVISHREAYLMDIADNYYSVEEWFEQNDYSMDLLREEVAIELEDEKYVFNHADNRNKKIYRVIYKPKQTVCAYPFYDDYSKSGKEDSERHQKLSEISRLLTYNFQLNPFMVKFGPFVMLQMYASYDKEKAKEKMDWLNRMGLKGILTDKEIDMEHDEDTLDYIQRRKTDIVYGEYTYIQPLGVYTMPYFDKVFELNDEDPTIKICEQNYMIYNGIKEAWVYDITNHMYIQVVKDGVSLIKEKPIKESMEEEDEIIDMHALIEKDSNN